MKKAGKTRGDEQRLTPESVERERVQFRQLLLSNPNYFGNLKASPFQPVFPLQANTTYEEIGCVGFNPDSERLHAVVFVNQPFGYGGGICSSGTEEHVRFYISFNNGASWDDLGITSFLVYDIPEGTEGRKRLEYAVTLQTDIRKRLCRFPQLPLVRAILEWNAPPPPNTPDHIPVWGEVQEARIQIDKLEWIIFDDLLSELDLNLAAKFADVVNLKQPLMVAAPQAQSLAELSRQYAELGVEPHRLAFPLIQQQLDAPHLSPAVISPAVINQFADAKLDLGAIIDALQNTDGSTFYEELGCVGYDPDENLMVGILTIKRPGGYSGSLCSNGSQEYITFWGDLNGNGTFETCLGTASVTVYDFNNIPNEGISYAVALPVNFDELRQPCAEGPVLVRIRAILSWLNPAPCFNPNHVPTWGNREETTIHIASGISIPPNVHLPVVQTVGGMNVAKISLVNGLANGNAQTAGFTAHDSPFGGEVIVSGRLTNPTNISAGAAKLKYKIQVREFAGVWQTVDNTFELGLDQVTLSGPGAGVVSLPPVNQSVDFNGWYDYQEDNLGNVQIYPAGNVLARWMTHGLTGLWEMRVLSTDGVSTWVSGVVRVRIDSAAPNVSLAITSGGGACADFTIGDSISGTYSVTDEHFSSLTLTVIPMNPNPALRGSFTSPAPTPGVATMPLSRTYAGAVSGTGEAGTWALDTTNMPRCGYVIRLSGSDRTIVNSGFVGRQNHDDVGLCLREPGE